MDSVQTLDEILDEYNSGDSTFQIAASKLVELAEVDDGVIDFGEGEDDGIITCLFPDPNLKVTINYVDKTIVTR